ncbi:MAG TPA: DUF1573 domain-containing protein [Mariniphaga anaerophila]|uniref:DUF1573 domain-containing protein n=1 Tax=Mariniphaga anaerophila TaxID=1484053 RepID=A0A831LMG3_9BACT|nr:DUF1573 domain-containing protein [Mariniphaga anaerophila]
MHQQNFKFVQKAFLVIVAVALSAFSANAQEPQTSAQDSIIFNKLEHDYGTIERGGDGQCEFVFTNKGASPLVLSNVRASCGCTVPQWPREPIPPGETGSIKVKYNTNIVGTFNKMITVNSNAANSMVRLRVKGQVVKDE